MYSLYSKDVKSIQAFPLRSQYPVGKVGTYFDQYARVIK